METRRELLRALALGTAAASLPATALAASLEPAVEGGADEASPAVSLQEGAPWWLFAPLGPGSALAAGWSLGSLSPVARGGSVLELVHSSGERARVHVCGHDGHPRGLAHGALVDLLLMDGGDGHKPTDEALGCVLLGLAERVRDNEASGAGDLGPLAVMMTHPDRVARFGAHTLT